MSASSQIPEPLGAEPLSIAVISPDDQRREAAIGALDKFPNGRIREFISYPPDVDAVTRMLKQNFDVVVVDLDSDAEYALHLVENICADGATNVIVYSARVDPGLMVRCLRAGAREFLHMPLTPSAMTEALMRVWSRRLETPAPVVEEVEEESLPEVELGKLFAFVSAKGGSGVTTLACSFAVSLAEVSKQRTLLIDLNLPLGDAALNLGLKSMYSTVNAFENAGRLDAHFLSSLLVQHGSGLWVLSAPSEMTPIQLADDAVGTLLRVAREDFENVVVDAGSRLDLQRTFPFDDSATLYLVTQLGIPELRNANRMIKGFPVEGGPKLEVIVNRFDAGSHGIEEAHVTKALSRSVRWKIPNDYAAVRRMQNSATPLTQEDSQISRAIQQMTRSVCGLPAIPEKKKGFSFF
jgi:pilus assembly protein CpaE